MVIRSWRGYARPEMLQSYLTHVSSGVFPHLRTLKGFEGATIMTRPLDSEVEILIHTRWSSRVDIHDFAGNDIETAVVEPAAQAVLSRYDTTAQHFDVVATVDVGGLH